MKPTVLMQMSWNSHSRPKDVTFGSVPPPKKKEKKSRAPTTRMNHQPARILTWKSLWVERAMTCTSSPEMVNLMPAKSILLPVIASVI